MRPITHSQDDSFVKSAPLGHSQLQSLLSLNQASQQQLKAIKEAVGRRMQALEQYISTHRLRSARPPMSQVLSYLKFERTLPPSYHQQSRVLQQQAIRSVREEDYQFMSKLNPKLHPKKGGCPRRQPSLDLAKLSPNPLLLDFTELAGSSPFKNGLELFQAWHKKHMGRAPRSPYSRLEERLIVDKQRVYGGSWEKICQFVEQRSFDEIYYEFHNRLNPQIVRGRWTLRQSVLLLALVEHLGPGRWADISAAMGEKGELQVRERYCNVLMPSLVEISWSPQQEGRLLEAAIEKDFCWKELAKEPLFRDKTDNSLWRKCRNMLTRMTEEELTAIVPRRTRRGVLQKLLRYKQQRQNRRKAPGQSKHEPQPSPPSEPDVPVEKQQVLSEERQASHHCPQAGSLGLSNCE